MFKAILISLLLSMLIFGSSCAASAEPSDHEVVVLMAPSVNEAYYESVFADIIAYDINFVNTVRHHIPVVLVVDSDTLPYVEGQIPAENIVESATPDIWIRDFSPAMPSSATQFQFRPNYLSSADASWIANGFTQLKRKLNVSTQSSDLILDGGNVVHNGADYAIVTDRVLDDNPTWTRAEIEAELIAKLNLSALAIIPQYPDDATGHSDGILMWLDDTTLMINEDVDPYQTALRTVLDSAFPDANIVEIPVDYTPEEFDGFGSACGLHVNSLVTDNLVILPTYGQDNDSVVHDMIAAQTDKTIVSVDASAVCFMGGSVRCLTWYAKGSQATTILAEIRGTLSAVKLGQLNAQQSPSPLFSLAGLLSAISIGGLIKQSRG
ncbi:MAG: agmatine deiminase family protein [Candidatus Promineifilaceae bacterium]